MPFAACRRSPIVRSCARARCGLWRRFCPLPPTSMQVANAAAAAEKKFVAAARHTSAGEDGQGGGSTGGGRDGAPGADNDHLLGAMTLQEVDFSEALIEEREQGVAEIAAAVQ